MQNEPLVGVVRHIPTLSLWQRLRPQHWIKNLFILAPLLGEYRAPHSHSVAVDPATHRVYLPIQDIDGKSVLRIMKP